MPPELHFKIGAPISLVLAIFVQSMRVTEITLIFPIFGQKWAILAQNTIIKDELMHPLMIFIQK